MARAGEGGFVMPGKPWKTSELRALRAAIQGGERCARVIAQTLGTREPWAVYSAAKRHLFIELRRPAAKKPAAPRPLCEGEFWTPPRVAILRAMWGAARTKKIAEAIGGGCTGNAVIGKAHRLGLPRTARAVSNQRASEALRERRAALTL